VAATYDVAKLLVDAGADMRAKGHGCGTPLQVASENGREGVVRMLLDAGVG